jgi:NadR type nicotinamide-nucleotide adenylyltransferase
MSSALVLMKALPVTRGHEALIEFAKAYGTVYVLMDTHPDEPDVELRMKAIQRILGDEGYVYNEVVIPQKTEDDPLFWQIWEGILADYEFCDYVIGSEDYCKRVAEIIDATYVPYDPERILLDTRATSVRDNPLSFYGSMVPEFQQEYRTTVTVFGAESTGKTTLAKTMARSIGCPWVYEYARPYLETVGTDITVESMTAIWKGQQALQGVAWGLRNNSPLIVQDTDLFTTIGYWEQPHWQETLGPVPKGLIKAARLWVADQYLITQSNIPFEEDPLRYGGDKRESPDEYWVGVAQKYDLPYTVLDASDRVDRLTEACGAARIAALRVTSELRYDRRGA